MNRFLFSVIVILIIGLGAAPATWAQVAGGACTGSATAGPDANGANLKCNGSTWQVVSTFAGTTTTTGSLVGSRAINTWYRNTSGKTMLVNASFANNAVGNTVTAFVGSGTGSGQYSSQGGFASPGSGYQGSVPMTVPIGWYYGVFQDGGSWSVATWVETTLPF